MSEPVYVYQPPQGFTVTVGPNIRRHPDHGVIVYGVSPMREAFLAWQRGNIMRELSNIHLADQEQEEWRSALLREALEDATDKIDAALARRG